MKHTSKKKQRYSNREEEKANRLIKVLCIGLLFLALLTIIGVALAS